MCSCDWHRRILHSCRRPLQPNQILERSFSQTPIKTIIKIASYSLCPSGLLLHVSKLVEKFVPTNTTFVSSLQSARSIIEIRWSRIRRCTRYVMSFCGAFLTLMEILKRKVRLPTVPTRLYVRSWCDVQITYRADTIESVLQSCECR
jgi:hypothetical protein